MAATVRRVDVGGRAIAYRRAGSGPPLVLLHGFLCDSRVWRRQLAELADEFDVVAWDAPGAGLSPDPPAGFALADWAICLAGFLEALGLGPAHIVGLSWGGLLAQELFRLAPERIRTLVLADTYAGWKGSFGDEVAQQRFARCERDSSLPADDLVRGWVPVEFFTENVAPDVTEEMASVVRDFHSNGFRLMARSLAETDTTGLLADIDVPTLLVWGDGDRRSPREVAAAFDAAIPHARLQMIANAGHVSNMERPEEFSAHVRRFARANQRPQIGNIASYLLLGRRRRR
jgi:pimeloyl-ACP methyl ester carboxylesterase